MPKNISIEETFDTPQIILNKEDGIFEIKGKTLPEDASIFYKPILKWIKDYCANPNKKTAVNIELEYINSSSIKQIVNILIQLENLHETNKGVIINWRYKKGDELIETKGKEIQSVLDLPINFEAL